MKLINGVNPYFFSHRLIVFLRRNMEAAAARGQDIPASDWLTVELWESLATDEPIRFPEKWEELKELAH